SALYDNIVDAHRDEIDAYGVVAPKLLGQVELGADTIGTRYQDRLFVFGRRQREQPAEAAEPGEHLRPCGAGHERLYALNQRVAGIDVDSGILVCKRFAGHVPGLVREVRLRRETI